MSLYDTYVECDYKYVYVYVYVCTCIYVHVYTDMSISAYICNLV